MINKLCRSFLSIGRTPMPMKPPENNLWLSSSQNDIKNFHYLLNPQNLQDLEYFYASNNFIIPRPALVFFFKIYASTLKKEEFFTKRAFYVNSRLIKDLSKFLKIILVDGTDMEYSNFYSLIGALVKKEGVFKMTGISKQDWFTFIFNLKQKINNLNYDIRSLIKISNKNQISTEDLLIKWICIDQLWFFFEKNCLIENFHLIKLVEFLSKNIWMPQGTKIIAQFFQPVYYSRLLIYDKIDIFISLFRFRQCKGFNVNRFVQQLLLEITD